VRPAHAQPDRPARRTGKASSVCKTCPITCRWQCPSFRGVYDRRTKQVHLFERVPGGAFRAPVNVTGLDDPLVRENSIPTTTPRSSSSSRMLDGGRHPFDRAAVHAGKQTPVYFGSAVNNFGVQLLLDGFLRDSIAPSRV